jgi:hypothetical protein
MKYGAALPYGSARMAANLAQLAEKTGWDGCFMGDAIWCEDPMIGLTAAAMVTRHIRLGTMLVPAPLRKPWKLASESVALDRLSNGRLILGLGAGAIWMGWHAFPDEVTSPLARARMLDETIDILTRLFARKPFDYSGQYFNLKLTALDEQYYPPAPSQQPRIPIWTPGLWPRKKSIQRALKCDGVLVEKVGANGGENVTPDDVRDIAAYVRVNRTLATPFDIVVSGQTRGMSTTERRETLLAWEAAGTTWWIETCYGDTEEQASERILQGPLG